MTRTSVRFIIRVEHKFHVKEDTNMTTFGFVMILIGAGSIAANVMRLIDCIDRPAPRRRRMA